VIEDYEMVTGTNRGEEIGWENGNRSVYNLSLAYSYQIAANLQLSIGSRTNNFAYENKQSNAAIRQTILDGNHLHFVLGSKLNLNRNSILLGIDYGAIRNIPDEENFEQFSNQEVLSPNLQGLQKRNISILFTYGFIIDELVNMRSR
jgi:hypothetical protein